MTTAVYLLNRAPTKSVVGMTLYEAWCGRKPSVDHLRTFRSIAHIKVLGAHNAKLEDRSIPTILLGYEQGSKAYRVYNPATKKVQVSRDVVFDEENAWNWDGAAVEDRPTGGDDMFVVSYHTDPAGHHNDNDVHEDGLDVDDDPGHGGGNPGSGSAPGTPMARTPRHSLPSSPSTPGGGPWWGDDDGDDGSAAGARS